MTKSRTPIYQGTVVDLGIESIRLPNGTPLTLEVVRHPGGAAAVAIDQDRQVCLLRQYRHAAGGWLWELPAGKIDPGESPQTTARRELTEEAGIQANSWAELGHVVTTPGFCDEIIHLYLAQELTSVAAQPMQHELIEIHWFTITQALAMVAHGTVRDAKTLCGLFLATTKLAKN